MPETPPSDLLCLDIPCDQHAPAVVRGALAELEQDEWSPADGLLVASELVTNAVLHSGSAADHTLNVRASLRGDCLRISVHDPGTSGEEAPPRDPGPHEVDGWGLRVIDQLAERWGAGRPDGYRVWAELPIRR
jgi:anti-sigma regulatory factor (Ser/Thr protein kinase)